MELAGAILVFIQPMMFWLLLPVLGIALWQIYNKSQKIVVILLRALLLSIIVLALSNPTLTETLTKKRISALIDVSGSIPSAVLSEMATRLSKFTSSETELSILPFAKSVASESINLQGELSAKSIQNAISSSASKIPRDATNIASALEAATARYSTGPILLFTDGFATTGNTKKVASRLGQQNRPVFPILLENDVFLNSQLEISSLYAPVTSQAGNKEFIYSSVRNTLDESRKAVLEFWLDEKLLAKRAIEIAAGKEQRVKVETPKLEGGLQRIRAVLRNQDGTSTTQHRWISVKEKSKLLLVHGGEEDKSQLFELVRLKGYSAEHIVASEQDWAQIEFSRFSSIILNNVAKRQLPDYFLPSLDTFAKQGGGVLLVGGDRSFGLGGYINTPLEKLSPLKFKPPQTQKKRLRVAVALVIDKSGSMKEQGRMLAAKRAAILSLDALKDEDYITIIGFDHAPFLVVDITTAAEARNEIEKRLQSLTPVGQTNLLPALGLARQKLIRSKAGRKHMIVLSDGQFSGSNDIYLDEINSLKRERITISSVALGSDADLPFLRYLAQTGNGAFHHTLKPDKLPKIFLEDIKIATGEETMAERQLFPVGLGPGGLSSTQVKKYPAVKGFVETLPKKGSTLELITKRARKVFPILATWKYGKGRVAAFTSDANGRWSQLWVRWPKFLKFWGDIFDWIRSGSTGRVSDIDFDLRYSLVQGTLAFELLVYDKNLRNAPAPPILATILDPANEQSAPNFTTAAPGRFSAQIPNAQAGDYKLSIRYGKVDLPPIGITLNDDSFGEQAGLGINYAALEKIAEESGGKLNPEVDSLPLAQSKTSKERKLYPTLLLIAFLLIIAEAIIRERLAPKS